MNPYELHEQVARILESGGPNAKADAERLVKMHGYTTEQWDALAPRIAKAGEDKGFLGRAIENHHIQTIHGNAGRGADPLGGKHISDQLRVLADTAGFGIPDFISGQLPGQTTADQRQATRDARDRLTPIERIALDVSGAVIGPGGTALKAGAATATAGLSKLQQLIAAGKGFAKQTPRLAGQGAAYGTADYAGHTLGDSTTPIDKRVEQAAVAAAAGGAGGVVLPAAIQGVGSAVGAGVRAVTGAAKEGLTKAQQKILGKIEADAEGRAAFEGRPKPSPTGSVLEARQQIMDPTNPGAVDPNAMLAETGPGALALTQGVVQQPGAGSTATRMAIADRARGEEGRMQGAVQQNLGPFGRNALVPGNAAQSVEHLRETQARLHENFNPILNNQNIQIDPARVEALVNHIDTMLARLPPGPSVERANLERARQGLILDPGTPGTAGIPGNAYTLPTPPTQGTAPTYNTDPQQLHKLKMIHSGFASHIPGETAGAQAAASGANKQVAGRLDEILDTHVPGYQQINERSRALTRNIEDITEVGEKLFSPRTSPIQVGEAVNRGQGPVYAGAQSKLGEIVEGSPQGTHAAISRIFDPAQPDTMAKLRMIYGEEGTQRLIQQIEAETRRKQTTQSVVGNPPTAERIAAKEDLNEGVAIPRSTGIEHFVVSMLAAGKSALDVFRNKEVRDEIGRATSLRGDDLDRYLGDLIANIQIQRAKAADSKVTGAPGGVLGVGLLGDPNVPQPPGLTIDIDRPNR